ncbi:MetQ/NlpA family ABC transporter substrate-binding protein [Psychrilyobacter atlanticus]|uniref:MetQ/NlpA family ABC transporter substrate-binding protein n=1 Tax=Psychrilyobacter atlanticus TaxID=271091 RepID=UPI00048E3A86|nr:MetQ/NlpA family ABC transporter substrate-binding protein [Psychrilyobacter atlanticus]
MINLKKSVFIQRISLFFLLSLSLFSAPLKIGVSSDFNAELVNFIMEQDKTLDIELVRYEKNKNLNRELLDEKIDVNIFQTLDYLNSYNDLNDSSLESIGETYTEPIGIYSDKHSTIKSMVAGDIIAVPNDPSNKKRSLIFLEKMGLIKLDHRKQITIDRILSNPFKIEIVGVDASILPRFLEVADYVILNGGMAFSVGYTPEIDSLFLEDFNKKYINIIASREEMLENKKVVRFSKLIQSKETKLFILEKYGNNVSFF